VQFFVVNLPIPDDYDLEGKLAELVLDRATPCPMTINSG